MVAATFVIATRNRLESLRNLVASTLSQTVPVETIVMDDGESDAVQAMIAAEFPGVRYARLGTGRGPAFQRNRGVELASSEFVFPFDDDTVLASRLTVAQTLAEFDDPRIAAVGIPFIDVRHSARVRQRAPSAGTWLEHAFIGAAHAVRRSLFLRVGGYREQFFYMGEEGDLSIRLLAEGFVVRVGNADPVHHLESPSRNLALADFYGRRNDVRFAWHNVPTAVLPVHLAGTTINGLRTATRSQNPGRALLGMCHGYADILRGRLERQPVTPQVYRLHRRLKKSGPLSLDAVGPLLPPSDHHRNDGRVASH